VVTGETLQLGLPEGDIAKAGEITKLGEEAEALAKVADGAQDVSKVGNKLRNGHLAGGVHPTTGVPFDAQGYPDFSNFLYKEGPNDVMIEPTGNRSKDFKAANEAAGYASTPKGYTWHHHQTPGRMQLAETEPHAKTGHTGGFSSGNQIKY
jgi:hypothetical protein